LIFRNLNGSEILMEIPQRNDFCIVSGGVVPASLTFLDNTQSQSRVTWSGPLGATYIGMLAKAILVPQAKMKVTGDADFPF
jgi:hypothetical protein